MNQQERTARGSSCGKGSRSCTSAIRPATDGRPSAVPLAVSLRPLRLRGQAVVAVVSSAFIRVNPWLPLPLLLSLLLTTNNEPLTAVPALPAVAGRQE
jgi:hypothetical protein